MQIRVMSEFAIEIEREEVAAMRFERSANFVARAFQDQTVMVPVVQGVADMDSVYVLNELGSYIYSLLDTKTLSEIIDSVTSKYEVLPDQARADIEAFLQELTGLSSVRPLESSA
jgi:hypothetical protein